MNSHYSSRTASIFVGNKLHRRNDLVIFEPPLHDDVTTDRLKNPEYEWQPTNEPIDSLMCRAKTKRQWVIQIPVICMGYQDWNFFNRKTTLKNHSTITLHRPDLRPDSKMEIKSPAFTCFLQNWSSINRSKVMADQNLTLWRKVAL